MYPGGDRSARSPAGRVGRAHHPDCPTPFDPCRCEGLWAADRDTDDDLTDAYAEVYDPDWGG